MCGHYELVELLLESGALAERDTFQGERCIYNALNDKIRNLLLKYDYSKSTDPLQPWAAHITSLLTKQVPKTSDIVLHEASESSESFELHKFLLSTRSPYFHRKLAEAPGTTTWKLPPSIPIEACRLVLRYLYLGDIPRDIVDPRSFSTEEQILTGVDKISKQLEIEKLWEAILSGNDRRLARQRHQDEVNRAQQQVEGFFRNKVLGHKMFVEPSKVGEVKWPHDNAMFADCLLRADEPGVDEETEGTEHRQRSNGIPIGPGAGAKSQEQEGVKKARAILYPVHKAMLIRSPYFETMFSSSFREAQQSDHLHVVKVDCLPEVLEIVLAFLYTEKVECPLEYGLDLLYVSDMLFLDKLKTKAAVAISTLGSGDNNILIDRTHTQDSKEAEVEVEPINVYDVIHAAWDLRVQRLENFAARYLAYRLEDYIDEEEFAELIQESAARLKTREETDTIELLDDIRYYLSERFRLRFEDAGLDEMLDEEGEINAEAVEALNLHSNGALASSVDADQDDHLRVAQSSENGAAKTAPPEGLERREGIMRTLDGKVAEDEFASDAINYQILLEKIDSMLDKLKLDA